MKNTFQVHNPRTIVGVSLSEPLSFVFVCARCALSVCRYVCVSVRTLSPELWQLRKPNAGMLASTTETGVLFPGRAQKLHVQIQVYLQEIGVLWKAWED